MRRMTREEILFALNHGNWASICTVDLYNRPFAIEATYFLPAKDRIGFMINPRGTTLKNIRNNPNVFIKITYASNDLSCWLGASFWGIGKVETDRDEMKLGWAKLEKVMDTDYSRAIEKFSNPDKASPFLEIQVEQMTGQCSCGKNEDIDYNQFN